MKSMSQREKLYVGVFLIALLWGGWNYRGLFFPGADDRQPPPQAAAAAVTAQAPAALSTPPQALRPADTSRTETYTPPEWRRDPFHRAWRSGGTVASAGPVARQPSALRLSAVVVRADSRYAVINGRVVREGEMVEGRKVLKVEESSVLVLDNGTEVTLNL